MAEKIIQKAPVDDPHTPNTTSRTININPRILNDTQGYSPKEDDHKSTGPALPPPIHPDKTIYNHP